MGVAAKRQRNTLVEETVTKKESSKRDEVSVAPYSAVPVAVSSSAKPKRLNKREEKKQKLAEIRNKAKAILKNKAAAESSRLQQIEDAKAAVVQQKEREEVKTFSSMSDALGGEIMQMLEQQELRAQKETKAKQAHISKGTKLTEKKKNSLALSEISQFNAVASNPVYIANPFGAIQTHLQASVSQAHAVALSQGRRVPILPANLPEGVMVFKGAASGSETGTGQHPERRKVQASRKRVSGSGAAPAPASVSAAASSSAASTMSDIPKSEPVKRKR